MYDLLNNIKMIKGLFKIVWFIFLWIKFFKIDLMNELIYMIYGNE